MLYAITKNQSVWKQEWVNKDYLNKKMFYIILSNPIGLRFFIYLAESKSETWMSSYKKYSTFVNITTVTIQDTFPWTCYYEL